MDHSVKPPVLHLQPIFESRFRYERRIDRDLDRRANDNKVDLFERFRAGVRYHDRRLEAEIVAQHSEGIDWAELRITDVVRRDILLANVALRQRNGTLTLGRQYLQKAEGRLLSAADWNNLATTWDLVRWKSGRWDVFAGSLGVFTRPSRFARLQGVTYTEPTRETMLILDQDGSGSKRRSQITLSQFRRERLGRTQLAVEGALQYGRRERRDVEAWALFGTATHPILPRLNLVLRGALASGGTRQGRTHTFSQLYGAQHFQLGVLDMQGWQNVQYLGVGPAWQAAPGMEVRATYQRYGLWDGTDAWYAGSTLVNPRGRGLYRDPTGRSGRDLGSEIDLDIRYQNPNGLNFQAGAGLFLPGNYPRAFNGRFTTSSVWGYVQIGYRF